MNKSVVIHRWYSPTWIAEKSYLWARSLLRIKPSDVVCAYYPKTGSTWVRIFIFNLLRAKELGDHTAFTFDDMNETMPEWGHRSFFNHWPFKSCPLLLKTHRSYNWCFRNNRCALFMREPRDAMISMFHYMKAKKKPAFDGTLQDIVHHPNMGLRHYMNFYSSWEDRAGICIKYEEMRANPQTIFLNLLRFLGVDCSEQEIDSALEASSLKKTQDAQQRSSDTFRDSFKEGFTFARSGNTGEGMDSFDDELNDYYQKLRQEYRFDLYDF